MCEYVDIFDFLCLLYLFEISASNIYWYNGGKQNVFMVLFQSYMDTVVGRHIAVQFFG